MKNIPMFFVACILFANTLYSQNTFNNLYSLSTFDVVEPFLNDVFVFDDGSFASFGRYDSSITFAPYTTWSPFYASKFGSNGSLEYTRKYGIDNYWYAPGFTNCVIKSEKGLLMSSYKGLPNQDTCMVFLVHFKDNLDTLWTRTYYKDTMWTTGRGLCATADGGYLIVGESLYNTDGSISPNLNGMLLKVDSLGQQQWARFYGSNDMPDAFYKVVPTPDGGYLIGGTTWSGQDETPLDRKGNWWLVKTDALGQMQWERQYTDNDKPDGGIETIVHSTDGSYYLGGGMAYFWDVNQGSDDQATLIKLDANYNTLWQITPDNMSSTTIHQTSITDAVETPDGNLVLLEFYNDAFWIGGMLRKIRADGTQIWQKCFDESGENGDSIYYNTGSPVSIKNTADGGFIVGGWANIWPDGQKTWLVKTDSLGCDGSNFCDCNLNVGIAPKEAVTFKIFPNPATETAHIQSPALIERIEVFSLSDPKWFKIFHTYSSEFDLPLQGFSPGIYMVRIGRQTQKLVVE